MLAGHLPFALALAVAALVRLAVTLAYWPVLFYSDSWSYVAAALGRPVVGMPADRPAGYPILIRALTLNGSTLDLVAVAQHLAGLATGCLVYLLLMRLGTRRWIATAAAAVVLLDSFSIALEQHVMAESFATLALVGSVCLLVLGGEGRRWSVSSGLLVAVAIGIRTAAAFAFPAWLGYLLWTRRGARALPALAALLLPLLVYSSVHAALGKGFGMGQAEGWFLYGRVGHIARCDGVDVPRGTEPLCRGPHPDDPGYYVWDADSPGDRLFGGIGGAGNDAEATRSNRLLRRFAVAVIVARPGAYFQDVASDLGRYFAGTSPVDPAVSLPRGRPAIYNRVQHDAYFPGLQPANRWPAALARAYHRVGRLRGWMLAPLVLVTLLSLALAAFGRRRPPLRVAEILLLFGVAAGMLVGSTATVAGIARYLVPAAPFLVAAAALAISGLLRPSTTSV